MLWLQIGRIASALVVLICSYILWVFLTNDGPEYSDGSKGAGQAFAMIFLLLPIAFFGALSMILSLTIRKKNSPSK